MTCTIATVLPGGAEVPCARLTTITAHEYGVLPGRRRLGDRPGMAGDWSARLALSGAAAASMANLRLGEIVRRR